MWKIILAPFKSLTVRLIGLGGWLITILASAFVAQNYENWAERRGISDIFGPTAPDAGQSSNMTALASVAQWAVATQMEETMALATQLS